MSASSPNQEIHHESMDSAAPPVLQIAAKPASPTRVRGVSRLEDRRLVRAVLDAEEGAFDRLYELYAQRIYRFAVSRLRDPIEAEDVVQDTFLEVHRCLSSWEGRSRLLTWMFGIAHHQIHRRFRKKTPIGVPIEELEASPPVAPSVSGEQRLDLLRMLDVCAEVLEEEVSGSQRQIFDLYYGENRAMKQIATDLGKSNQAVKVSLYRTRRAMHERLESRDQLLSA